MTHRKWIFAAAIGLLASFAAAAQDTPELKTDKDKFSYALGMNFGENFRQQGLDLDPAVFAKAFAESFSGGKTAITDEEMQAVLKAAAQEIRARSRRRSRQRRARRHRRKAKRSCPRTRRKKAWWRCPAGCSTRF